jgi:Zn-dependent protease with chaperone function
LSLFNIYLMIASFTLGLIYVRLQQAQYIGSAIRVHQSQYPEIFDIFRKHATKLGINRGTIYIKQDPTPNAFTLGINSCTIVLHSALVEGFDQNELDFVIGHELGHFKAGHTKISSFVTPLGNGNIFSNLLFGFWNRKAEYTADRCALALTKAIDPAISGLLKLTVGARLYDKFNLDAYLTQIKSSDVKSVRISEVLVSHPFTTILEINDLRCL